MQDQERILVEWGAGAENELRDTIERPSSTTCLVLMDASPESLESQDAQRANRWTEEQTLTYRANVLTGRIALAELTLA